MKLKISVILTLVLLLVLVNGCIEQNSETDDDSSSDDRKTDNENIEPDNHNDTNNEDKNEVDDEEEVEQEQDEEESIDYKDSGIILEIIMDDEDIRAYDRVNYSVPNAPSGSNITWEMGDGTVLYGMKVLYFHRSSNYFQINVTAFWEDEFAFGTEIVTVKNQDWINWSISGTADLKLVIGYLGFKTGPDMNPGITVPRVEVELLIWNVTREIEVGFCIMDKNDEGHNEIIEVLNSETVEGMWNEAHFEWEYSSDQMEKFESIRPYTFSFYYDLVNHSGHAEWKCIFNVYPFFRTP